MSEIYKDMQGKIKILEECGADNFRFCLKNMDCHIGFKKDIWEYICKKINITSSFFVDVRDKYDRLETTLKQKVFDETIGYLKATYLDFERERIQLISKNQLKTIIGCFETMAKIYNYDYSDIRLLKSGSTEHKLSNQNIAIVLRREELELRVILGHTERVTTRFEFVVSYWMREYIKDNETPYEFIVRVIDKINEENKFVEFVWDKDEE